FLNDPLSRERCVEALNAVRLSRIAREDQIGKGTMVFFPIFDTEDQVVATVGVTGYLQDIPRAMHQLQKGLPNFIEILHQTPNVVFTARPGGQIDYLSQRWYDVTEPRRSTNGSARAEDLIARTIMPEDYPGFLNAWARGIASQAAFSHR